MSEVKPLDASLPATQACSSCGTWERDHRLGGKSRMRRESHVRFREGVGVQFPRATRLQSGSLDDSFREARAGR